MCANLWPLSAADVDCFEELNRLHLSNASDHVLFVQMKLREGLGNRFHARLLCQCSIPFSAKQWGRVLQFTCVNYNLLHLVEYFHWGPGWGTH